MSMSKIFQCSVRDSVTHVRCKGTTVTVRTSGTYNVPVCAEHATGPATYRLGSLY